MGLVRSSRFAPDAEHRVALLNQPTGDRISVRAVLMGEAVMVPHRSVPVVVVHVDVAVWMTEMVSYEHA
jgi:hypothetical protein